MKLSLSALALACVSVVNAFPAHVWEKLAESGKLEGLTERLENQKRKDNSPAAAAQAIFEAIPTFDEKLQYIDTSDSGPNPWQAPGPDDLRGPCPGLNAFANHGFLPRNGYATVTQYIDVTMKVVGMGTDLSAFLSVLGGLIDGPLTAWSMGGTPTIAQGGPLGPQGHGLSGSHNKYENDISPTRGDLYQVGDNYLTRADQFQSLIDYCPNDVVDLACLTEYRAFAFKRSVANNPYFFNGPFPGLLVQPAAFTFIYRFMANHSADEPYGLLSHEVLQSWFGVEGTNGNYVARQGYERIPDNWYRRSLVAPYSIPYFLGDVVNAAVLHPDFLSIGGNLDGKTNNFAGVRIEDLTGGLFRSSALLEGNNLGCFAFQAAAQAKADFIILPAQNALQKAVGDVVTQLGCPQLLAIDEKELEQFPGYQKSNVEN